jgi:hypothetical protein
MKFKEFEYELHEKIKEFGEVYARGMRQYPDIFPDEMPQSDWWEQFAMHIESAR